MTSKQKNTILIAILLLFFAAIKLLILNWWQTQQGSEEAHAPSEACQITQNPCVFADGQTMALIGVADNKTPFAVEARGIPQHVQTITLSFSMRDMDMGFNRFELRPQGQGIWRLAAVHLPLCTANHNDWIMEWRVDEQKYTADFQTHVKM